VFWAYAAVSFLLLIVLMYVVADRVSQPASAPPVDNAPAGGATVPGALDNEFVPTDRDISECISAIPRPGCGSDARGGWRQSLVLVAILAGLALIAWRIVAGARKGRRVESPTS